MLRAARILWAVKDGGGKSVVALSAFGAGSGLSLRCFKGRICRRKACSVQGLVVLGLA